MPWQSVSASFESASRRDCSRRTKSSPSSRQRLPSADSSVICSSCSSVEGSGVIEPRSPWRRNQSWSQSSASAAAIERTWPEATAVVGTLDLACSRWSSKPCTSATDSASPPASSSRNTSGRDRAWACRSARWHRAISWVPSTPESRTTRACGSTPWAMVRSESGTRPGPQPTSSRHNSARPHARSGRTKVGLTGLGLAHACGEFPSGIAARADAAHDARVPAPRLRRPGIFAGPRRTENA